MSRIVVFLIPFLGACQFIPGTDSNLRSKAESDVRTTLKDPQSAMFRDIQVAEPDDGLAMVCGQVNARNGLGGYSGFHRFVAEPSSGSAMIDPVVSSDEADIISAERLCAMSGEEPCRRADRLIEEISDQAGFDALWKHCTA